MHHDIGERNFPFLLIADIDSKPLQIALNQLVIASRSAIEYGDYFIV